MNLEMALKKAMEKSKNEIRQDYQGNAVRGGFTLLRISNLLKLGTPDSLTTVGNRAADLRHLCE